MDNYKIPNTEEAINLLDELGYDVTGLNDISSFLYAKAQDKNVFNGVVHPEDYESISVDKLRDLVVLKRNDVKDATHTCENDFKYICIDERWHLMTTDGWFPVSVNPKALKPIQTVQAVLNDLDELREEYKDYNKDPALISGDVALANVHKCIVQYLHDDEPYGRWTTITDHFWSQYHLGMFLDPDTKFKFRFKPQTIKLELELPKPFEPKEGEKYWWINPNAKIGYEWDSNDLEQTDLNRIAMGVWRTEDEIKQVVEQLRKIRGTNS